MTDTKKTKRNEVLEFTLPGALIEAATTKIGSRRLGRLSPEGRAQVITALNSAAQSITHVLGAEAPRRGGKRKSKTADAPAEPQA